MGGADAGREAKCRLGLLLVVLVPLLGAQENSSNGVDEQQYASSLPPHAVHREPTQLEWEQVYSTDAPNDDITRDNKLIVFDRQPKPKDSAKPWGQDSVPQQYSMVQTVRGEASTSAHSDAKQQMFESLVSLSDKLKSTEYNVTEQSMDNFGLQYQRWNETLFSQTVPETEDKVFPYPPLHKAKEQKLSYEPLPPTAFEQESATPVHENSSLDVDVSRGTAADSARETYHTLPVAREAETTPTPTPTPTTTALSGTETDPGVLEYDRSGTLPPGEEVDYSEYDEKHPTTYTTPTRTDAPTPTPAPFKVTKHLMDVLVTPSTTTLQDADATIHPTLIPGRSEEEEELVTVDYLSSMDATQREKWFPRDKLKPWERQRSDDLNSSDGDNTITTTQTTHAYSEVGRNFYNTEFTLTPRATEVPETTTAVYTSQTVPLLSSIYAGQPPPLSNFIVVPSPPLYYVGNQTPRELATKTVANSAFRDDRDHFGIKQIVRENTVSVEPVSEEVGGGGSDLWRQPQFRMLGMKMTPADRQRKPRLRFHGRSDGWMANPASFFDLPLPNVLKMAMMVNSKIYSAKLHAAQSSSSSDRFEMDASQNPLKYHKKATRRPFAASAPPTQRLTELPDVEVVSGGSEDEQFRVESYVDEEALQSATDHLCGAADLVPLRTDLEAGAELLGACFVMAEHCLLYAASLERRINMNLTSCVAFCAQHPQCKSISYAKVTSICDIYAFRNGTSDAQLIRLRDYVYLQPTRKNLKKCLRERRLSGTPVQASSNPIQVENRGVQARKEETQEDAIVHKQQEDLTSMTSKVNPSAKVNPCPESTDILMIKADGFQLRNFGIDKFEQRCSESECIFSCLIDIADGKYEYNCTSATFDSKTEQCLLFTAGGNMKGNGHLVESLNHAHYEKTCADANLVQQCRGFPIERVPQKTLIGYNILTRTAASLLSCITMCYERYKGKSDCLSVMYFYTATEHNCVLNSESHLTVPYYFIDEVEETVDYASIDRCLDVRDNLVHSPTPTESPLNGVSSDSTVAVDMEDGSRILAPPNGFSDLEDVVAENSVVVDSDDGEQLEVEPAAMESERPRSLVSNEVRRSPPRFAPAFSPTPTPSLLATTTLSVEQATKKLQALLKKSIKRLRT